MVTLEVSSPLSSLYSSSSSLTSLGTSSPFPSSRVSSFSWDPTWRRRPSCDAAVVSRRRHWQTGGDDDGQEGRGDKAMTIEDVNEGVIDLKSSCSGYRNPPGMSSKSSEFCRMRKRYNRLRLTFEELKKRSTDCSNTVKIEREIEEGINKRLSTKLESKWKKSMATRPSPSEEEASKRQMAAEAEKLS